MNAGEAVGKPEGWIMHELINRLQWAVTSFRLNVTEKNATTPEGRDEIEHHVAVLATLLTDIQEEEND